MVRHGQRSATGFVRIGPLSAPLPPLRSRDSAKRHSVSSTTTLSSSTLELRWYCICPCVIDLESGFIIDMNWGSTVAIQTVFERMSSQASRDAQTDAGISHSILVVRGAYLEIPVLHLTQSQVQHLWGFDACAAGRVLEALVECRFLERTSRGGFVRAGAGRR
jgi:hypothetical protein